MGIFHGVALQIVGQDGIWFDFHYDGWQHKRPSRCDPPLICSWRRSFQRGRCSWDKIVQIEGMHWGQCCSNDNMLSSCWGQRSEFLCWGKFKSGNLKRRGFDSKGSIEPCLCLWRPFHCGPIPHCHHKHYRPEKILSELFPAILDRIITGKYAKRINLIVIRAHYRKHLAVHRSHDTRTEIPWTKSCNELPDENSPTINSVFFDRNITGENS